MNERNGRLNAWLDGLPRPSLFRACRPQPAFLSFGAAGYHAALAVTLGLGLFAGRSVLALLALSAVCAGSFFAWALLRRRITGRESYVVLEHVWVALAATAGASLLLREPVLPSLDVVSLGLATFLAFGRVGCTFAGCCHGLPSSVGLVYGHEHAREGFTPHLVGVRLFPVQLLEMLGLAAITLSGAVALPWAPPGRVLAWVLLAQAVLRFGLEGIRGDERPHLWGLSQARWMSFGQAAAAVFLLERTAPMTPARWAAIATVLCSLTLLVFSRARDAARRNRLLAPEHVAEVRALVRSATEGLADASMPVPPSVKRTRLGVSVGVSPHIDSPKLRAHVSLMLPFPTPDLALACGLAARAVPEADVATASASPVSLLHILVPFPLPKTAAPPRETTPGHALFGAVIRSLQRPAPTPHVPLTPGPANIPSPPRQTPPEPAPPSVPPPAIPRDAEPALPTTPERLIAAVRDPAPPAPAATPLAPSAQRAWSDRVFDSPSPQDPWTRVAARGDSPPPPASAVEAQTTAAKAPSDSAEQDSSRKNN